MNRLVDNLNEAKIFYLATVGDQKPSVRPIGGKPALNEKGFVEKDGKIYFYTDSRKPMYKQIQENSNIAMTFLVSAGFVRVAAKAVFEDNIEIKKEMLEENKSLTQMYQVDDEFFKVYYLSEIEAFLYAKGQAPIELS